MNTKRHSGQTTDTDRLPPISTTHPGHLGEGPERELWTTSLTSDMLALLAGATFIREVAQAGVGPQRSLGVSYSASSTSPHPSANTSLSASHSLASTGRSHATYDAPATGGSFFKTAEGRWEGAPLGGRQPQRRASIAWA